MTNGQLALLLRQIRYRLLDAVDAVDRQLPQEGVAREDGRVLALEPLFLTMEDIEEMENVLLEVDR